MSNPRVLFQQNTLFSPKNFLKFYKDWRPTMYTYNMLSFQAKVGASTTVLPLFLHSDQHDI